MNNITTYPTNKIFSRLLTNKSAKNYWRYVRELRERKTEDIFKKGLLLTKSNSIKERILGVNILAQFGFPRLHNKKIVNTYFELLEDETDYKIISALLSAIGHNNDKLTAKQIDQLCTFLNHKSVTIRYSLVHALSTVEKKKAVNALIELSSDKDHDIRNWATFGIGTQQELDSTEIRKALWERINDTDDDTKAEAIVGLANRNDERIKKVIIAELENGKYDNLLSEAILQLNDKDFLPYLNKTLKTVKKSKNKQIQAWVPDLEETIQELKKTVKR